MTYHQNRIIMLVPWKSFQSKTNSSNIHRELTKQIMIVHKMKCYVPIKRNDRY